MPELSLLDGDPLMEDPDTKIIAIRRRTSSSG